MNNSTQAVTIPARFVLDILGNYERQLDLYSDLFDLAKAYDLSNPEKHVPIDLYNACCAWIEKELGKYNLIRVGRCIGETVWQNFLERNLVSEKAHPLEILKALKVIAETVIHDPLNRGWIIAEKGEDCIHMTRTQTFNSKLQLGLLHGLVSRSPLVRDAEVYYVKSIEKGDEFDVYEVKFELLSE